MKLLRTFAIAAALTSAAFGQVSLNSIRIAAKDTVALAKFYEATFGLKETNRLSIGGGAEIFLNFGATVDAAKANKNGAIVLAPRASDEVKDPTAHLILSVTDMNATVAAIKANGGSMASEPRAFGNTVIFAIALDPAGNQIELLQQK